MSDLLTLLFPDSTNCSQKTSDLLKNGIFHMSLAVFPLKPKTWVSLRSLMTKEQSWAIQSGRPWQKRDGINWHFFTGKSIFCSQKKSKSFEKPMSEFPTLILTLKLREKNLSALLSSKPWEFLRYLYPF